MTPVSEEVEAALFVVAVTIGAAGAVTAAYRSRRVSRYALALTDERAFHLAVKTATAAGLLSLVGLYVSEYSAGTDPETLPFQFTLGTLVGLAGLLFGYANLELVASIAEVKQHPSFRRDGDADSLLASWRRSEHRYLVWRCLLREHHDGAYWAFYAAGAVSLPASFYALFLNSVAGVTLTVLLLSAGLVSFVAAVGVGYRMGFELDCSDVEGVEEAVEAARWSG